MGLILTQESHKNKPRFLCPFAFFMVTNEISSSLNSSVQWLHIESLIT